MKELLEKIGKPARLALKPMGELDVRVVDVKQAYGRVDFLVELVDGPSARGTVQQWVSADRLSFDE